MTVAQTGSNAFYVVAKASDGVTKIPIVAPESTTPGATLVMSSSLAENVSHADISFADGSAGITVNTQSAAVGSGGTFTFTASANDSLKASNASLANDINNAPALIENITIQ